MSTPEPVVTSFKYGDIVQSPMGRATIEGLYLPQDRSTTEHPDGKLRYIVRFSKRDFDDAIWRQGFSVFNGPSVSRVFVSDDLTLLESAPSTPQEAESRRQTRRANNSPSSNPPKYSGEVSVGQIWVSNKGGYRYRITKVVKTAGTVDFEWVDGKYTQEAKPIATLVSRYHLEEPTPSESEEFTDDPIDDEFQEPGTES